MLRKHFAALAAIDQTPALKYRVRRYFDLPGGSLFRALSSYSQADLVLCLVRINTPRARQIVETLIGKEITVGPACRFVYSFNKQDPSVKRQPVVSYVCEDPQLRRKSRLARIWHEFKPGRTREQLIRRGLTPGDIKRAEKRGLVRIAR